MERGLWTLLTRCLRAVPRRCPVRGRYSNRDILAVFLWSALHDRSVGWACTRTNWPIQAWRRRLPDQSTMSRRLRDDALIDDLNVLIARLQRDLPQGSALIADGKPLPVSKFSSDPDRGEGWGAGRHQFGYKLHAIIDSMQRLIAWALRPMNEAECTTTTELMASINPHEVNGKVLYADASYDSNPLHVQCEHAGVRLVAPRRRPGTKPCKNREHSPNRLASIDAFERGTDPEIVAQHRRVRPVVECYFGTLATWGGGLFALPAWARRHHRVNAWVAAKLAINAARNYHVKTTPA